METSDGTKCLYLGSFPVTLSNPSDRARYIAQQLENILIKKNRQSNGTAVSVKMALCGIQVKSQSTQDMYMIHALRRVSFSTCLSDLFAFAARDPGQPLDKQFCHVFRTKQADLLNSEIGSAFNSAYTLQRHRDDVSCTSGRESRASVQSVQSVQSVRSVRDRSQSQPDRDIATPSGSLRNEILKDRRDRSRSDHRYVYDYDSEDFGRGRKTSSESDDVIGQNSTNGIGNVTVRSKLSNKSDDSAISSLADDLERRVMLEIERQVRKPSSSRKPEPKSRKSSVSNSRSGPPDHSRLMSSDQSSSDRFSIRAMESSGYSSMGSTTNHHLAMSDAIQMSNYKTNPVAKKLRALAPGDHYADLDSRLKTADWYHKGLPKEVGISVLGASDPGTFLVLPQTLLLRGYEHVHEYQIINENKIGWYLKGSSRAFPHLLMLVAHYQRDRKSVV